MIKSLFRYAQVSGLSFCLNIGITILAHEWVGVSEEVAFGIAITVVFVVNFIAMRHYIFDGKSGDAGKQLKTYTFSAISFRLVEYMAFLLLHNKLGIDYRIAVVSIIAISAIIKFAFYRCLFEKKQPTAEPSTELNV